MRRLDLSTGFVLSTLCATLVAAGEPHSESSDFGADWGTVVSVRALNEAPPDGIAGGPLGFHDATFAHPEHPDPAFEMVVRPDGGHALVIWQNGCPCFEAGQRVRLVREADGLHADLP